MGKSPDYLFWMVREEIAYAFMEKKKSSIIILCPKKVVVGESLVTLIWIILKQISGKPNEARLCI